jgi:hypothetical protein
VHWKSETERNKYRGERGQKQQQQQREKKEATQNTHISAHSTIAVKKRESKKKILSPFYTSQIALAKVAKVYTKRERE